MKVDRATIIQTALNYKQVFYKLIDYLDSSPGSSEILQSLYINLYQKYVVSSGDEMAIRVLSLESLQKNGLVIHSDNQAGTLTLQSFIIEMYRFIDKKRIRELSHADFELIRKNLQTLCRDFENSLSISPGHDKYDEALITLFDTIDTALTRIKLNVESLTANADAIGARYKAMDNSAFRSVDSLTLHDDSEKLYKRFIIPCLEFLSPNTPMKPAVGSAEPQLTLTKSMERLSELHIRRGESFIGERIQYKLTAIRSFYKDISKIEKRVQRYFRTLSDERHRYNAIEDAFNALMGDIEELRHGKLKNTQLATDADSITRHESFTGLKKHSLAGCWKINWYDEVNNSNLIEEWVTSMVDNYKDISPRSEIKQLKPVTSPENERKIHVFRMLHNKSWPDELDNIYIHCHEWLKNELDDYELSDLLAAYEFCSSISAIETRLKHHFIKSRIEYGGYVLNYHDAALTRISSNSRENT